MSDSEMIISAVCSYYGIPKKALLAKTRKREIVEPRQMCHKLLRVNTRLGLSDIGLLTDKDHATVLFSNRTVDNLMLSNKQIKADYEALTEIIKSPQFEDYSI